MYNVSGEKDILGRLEPVQDLKKHCSTYQRGENDEFLLKLVTLWDCQCTSNDNQSGTFASVVIGVTIKENDIKNFVV